MSTKYLQMKEMDGVGDGVDFQSSSDHGNGDGLKVNTWRPVLGLSLVATIVGFSLSRTTVNGSGAAGDTLVAVGFLFLIGAVALAIRSDAKVFQVFSERLAPAAAVTTSAATIVLLLGILIGSNKGGTTTVNLSTEMCIKMTNSKGKTHYFTTSATYAQQEGPALFQAVESATDDGFSVAGAGTLKNLGLQILPTDNQPCTVGPDMTYYFGQKCGCLGYQICGTSVLGNTPPPIPPVTSSCCPTTKMILPSSSGPYAKVLNAGGYFCGWPWGLADSRPAFDDEFLLPNQLGTIRGLLWINKTITQVDQVLSSGTDGSQAPLLVFLQAATAIQPGISNGFVANCGGLPYSKLASPSVSASPSSPSSSVLSAFMAGWLYGGFPFIAGTGAWAVSGDREGLWAAEARAGSNKLMVMYYDQDTAVQMTRSMVKQYTHIIGAFASNRAAAFDQSGQYPPYWANTKAPTTACLETVAFPPPRGFASHTDFIGFCKAANPSVKVMMGIGGWLMANPGDVTTANPGGSNCWSGFFGTAGVKNLVSQITSLLDQYAYDGVDIDYERGGSPQTKLSTLSEAQEHIDFLVNLTAALRAAKPEAVISHVPLQSWCNYAQWEAFPDKQSSATIPYYSLPEVGVIAKLIALKVHVDFYSVQFYNNAPYMCYEDSSGVSTCRNPTTQCDAKFELTSTGYKKI